jgi:hypothetical protein
MRLINTLIWSIALCLALTFCIKPFTPEINKSDQALYVISGQITDQEGYQYVNVSISAEVSDPEYQPVPGCEAEIIDSLGNVFPLEDIGQGEYRAWMYADDLVPGMSYMLKVVTPTGEEIISDYDEMPSCPQVDSIYYFVEEHPTNDPEVSEHGINFYIDLDATGYDSRFFRWEIEETWEYHMDFIKQWYYDGAIQKLDPPDRSTEICWYTGELSEIFTVSTKNLSVNSYGKYPLHFVNNRTTRLSYIYSLLIKQYAISEPAYEYWDKLRTNSQVNGGLYEQQPLPIDGNLHFTSNPDQRVLGFFSATSVKSKRIFVSEIEGLEIDPAPLCSGPAPLGIFGWSEFEPYEYPIYFTRIDGAIFTLPDQCVDCTLLGGKNTKPEFWPE